jgi:hypothetical protein
VHGAQREQSLARHRDQAVIVLMLVVVALSAVIWRLRAHLLGWQQRNMLE